MRSKILFAICLAVLALGVSAAPAKDDQTNSPWWRKTFVESYDHEAKKDAKWDVPAREAVVRYSRLLATDVSGEKFVEQLDRPLTEAMDAGCDDPYIQYLFLRFAPEHAPQDKQQVAQSYRQMIPRIKATGYPNWQKFFVTLRGSEAIKAAGGSNTPPEVHAYRREATEWLMQLVGEKDLPSVALRTALDGWRGALRANRADLTNAMAELRGPLLDNWSQQAQVQMFLGAYHVEQAWWDRGGGYADTVTSEGWKGFEENLKLAAQELEKAWSLDPTDGQIARHMIRVELGQGQGRPRMEKWFQRAMALNPNDYDACWQKLYYLEPKWHGSPEEMIAFGRECVASKTWKGRVPQILFYAHEALSHYWEKPDRPKYWKQPGVWPDVKASFDRFFELNPSADGWHHDYAKYAFLCEAWPTLSEQIKLLGEVNYDYFGGKAAYFDMVTKARAHSVK
jgi:hypothetical protein